MKINRVRHSISRPVFGAILISSAALFSGCGDDDDGSVEAMDFGSNIIATMMPARDGVELETYIYLPEGEGPFPALVTRTLYGLPISPIGGYPGGDIDDDDLSEEEAIRLGWPLINERGYALVIQNTRGRYNSGGVDRSWLDDASDGYDLIEWVNSQPWSDGNIGVFGDSAVGFTALLAAAANPPSLDAVYAQVAPSSPYGIDFMPDNGASKLESLLLQGGSLAEDTSQAHRQALGLSIERVQSILTETQQYLEQLFFGLDNPLESPAWMELPLAEEKPVAELMPFWNAIRERDLERRYRDELNVLGKIQIPTYLVTLWQDVFFDSTMALHKDLSARHIPHHMLVFNGSHYEIDDPGLWQRPVMLDWFDHWLQNADNGITATPEVIYTVQGTDAAVSESDSWPPAGTEERIFYLHSDGSLAASAEATAAQRSYTYDPANPVITDGGRHLIAAAGTRTQGTLLDRDDVLGYYSQVLSANRRIAGSVNAYLSVSSSAVDTDFIIKLLDRSPGGELYLVLEQLIRVSRRNGRYAGDYLQPGEVVGLDFNLGDIAHEFKAGHQIVVAISSSDFPAWDRNLNTALSSFTSDSYQSSLNTIVNDIDKPNRIVLPEYIDK